MANISGGKVPVVNAPYPCDVIAPAKDCGSITLCERPAIIHLRFSLVTGSLGGLERTTLASETEV